MYGNNYNPWEQPPQYYEPPQTSRITAAYRADALADGVIAPVLKSAFLGFTLGVLAGLLVWQLHWPRGLHPQMAFALTWFTVMPLTFWTFTRRGQWLIERISGADLNGDGYIGQPIMQAPMLPSPDPVRIELIQNDGRQGDFIDLPAPPEKIKTLARGLVEQKRQFALSLWVGDHGIFSRSEFENLRAALIERGLAKWKSEKDPQRGVELTRQGQAVMRYLASDDYHPPALRGQ